MGVEKSAPEAKKVLDVRKVNGDVRRMAVTPARSTEVAVKPPLPVCNTVSLMSSEPEPIYVNSSVKPTATSDLGKFRRIDPLLDSMAPDIDSIAIASQFTPMAAPPRKPWMYRFRRKRMIPIVRKMKASAPCLRTALRRHHLPRCRIPFRNLQLCRNRLPWNPSSYPLPEHPLSIQC